MTATETEASTEVLTIDEAAAILRISRNAAYTLARPWRTTGGRVGLRCLELGRSLRVPRAAIRQMLEGATLTNVTARTTGSRDPATTMATRCEYLTARCPFGCEVWLHPRAVGPHADRYPGHPWTDDRLPITQVILADDNAERARRICPPDTLHRPTFSGDRLLKPRPGMYLRVGLVSGVVVDSPLANVTGRRWWTVVRTADERGQSTDVASGPDEFLHLEQQLGLEGHFVRCDICGDDITPRRLTNHRRTNSVCRFLADTAEVRTFWKLGYRDPYRVRDQRVPITWTELNGRVAWCNRLHVVRFRLWTAVLLRIESDTGGGFDQR